MSRSAVKELLGEPDDIDEYSFSGLESDRSESWHYDGLDLSMSFDAEDDWRLITLAVSSEDYLLEGQALVGKSRDELLSLLKQIGLNDLKSENEDTLDMPGHELVAERSRFMNFWLQEGVVKEIQWSPYFDEDDMVKWPSA